MVNVAINNNNFYQSYISDIQEKHIVMIIFPILMKNYDKEIDLDLNSLLEISLIIIY